MKRLLVTGANGFIGRHLCQRLKGNYELIEADQQASHQPRGKFHRVDLSNPEATRRLIAETNPNFIFHLSGLAKGSRTELFRANSDLVSYLLKAVHEESPRTGILLMGSAAEYGVPSDPDQPVTEEATCRPVTDYGASKLKATTVAQAMYKDWGVRCFVVRPFNVIGPGMSSRMVLGRLIEELKQRQQSSGVINLAIGNLAARRDFVSVDDTTEALIRLMLAEPWGEIVNICSGHATSVRDLILSFVQQVKMNVALVESRAHDAGVPIIFGSTQKLETLIGFLPNPDLKMCIEQIAEEFLRTSGSR